MTCSEVAVFHKMKAHNLKLESMLLQKTHVSTWWRFVGCREVLHTFARGWFMSPLSFWVCHFGVNPLEPRSYLDFSRILNLSLVIGYIVSFPKIYSMY